MFKAWNQQFQAWQFTRKNQHAFLEDTLSLIEDGVPATSAIGTIKEINIGINKIVAQNIENNLAQGKSLADGLENWFSPSVVEIIRAGEAGGTLQKSLRAAIETFAEQIGAIRVIVHSLVYPLVVLVLALVVLVFVKNSVLNNFLDMKPL